MSQLDRIEFMLGQLCDWLLVEKPSPSGEESEESDREVTELES